MSRSQGPIPPWRTRAPVIGPPTDDRERRSVARREKTYVGPAGVSGRVVIESPTGTPIQDGLAWDSGEVSWDGKVEGTRIAMSGPLGLRARIQSFVTDHPEAAPSAELDLADLAMSADGTGEAWLAGSWAPTEPPFVFAYARPPWSVLLERLASRPGRKSPTVAIVVVRPHAWECVDDPYDGEGDECGESATTSLLSADEDGVLASVDPESRDHRRFEASPGGRYVIRARQAGAAAEVHWCCSVVCNCVAVKQENVLFVVPFTSAAWRASELERAKGEVEAKIRHALERIGGDATLSWYWDTGDLVWPQKDPP